MLLRIKPMKVGKYVEPCMLEIKGEQKDSEFYPVAVVHVDNFWQGREGGNQVYNLLQNEKVVEIEISLTPRALDGAYVKCQECETETLNNMAGNCALCNTPRQ